MTEEAPKRKVGRPRSTTQPTVADVNDDLFTRIADLALKDMSTADIAKELMLAPTFIGKVMKQPEMKDWIRRRVQTAVARRAGELITALYDQVKEGNVMAIKTGFQIIGALEPESNVKTGDTSLTVVLPGAAPQPKTFEVTDGSDAGT